MLTLSTTNILRSLDDVTVVKASTVLASRKAHKLNDKADSVNARSCIRHLGDKEIFEALFYVIDDEHKFQSDFSFTRMYGVREGAEQYINSLLQDIKVEDVIDTRRRSGKSVIEKAIPVNPALFRKALKKARKMGDIAGSAIILELARNIKDDILYERYDTSNGRCRLFAMGPSIQGLKKEYRSIIFGDSGYADVDVVNSVPTDLIVWLKRIGADDEDIALIEEYVNSKGILLEMGITKTQFLALIFGAKQTISELKNVQNIIKKYANKIPQTASLPYRQVAAWGKKLAHILFAMETEKVATLSQIFKTLGYTTHVFSFDGMILSSAPSEEELIAVCEEYERLTNNPIALKIKEIF